MKKTVKIKIMKLIGEKNRRKSSGFKSKQLKLFGLTLKHDPLRKNDKLDLIKI